MKNVFLFFPTSTRNYVQGEREREREERGSVRRRAKMMKGAAVAMISALAKTTSAIEANVGRRRVTRLEGWMHSAWKIMRSYARARASWIMQGGYTTEPRADRLKCQPRAGLPSSLFVRNKERNTRRKLPPFSIKFSWNKFAGNPFAFPFFSRERSWWGGSIENLFPKFRSSSRIRRNNCWTDGHRDFHAKIS